MAIATADLPFDIENAKLPAGFEEKALASGGFPYEKQIKRKRYERDLELLQFELVKLQTHIQKTGERLVVVFEGRDSAGKGGCINRFMQHLNPRHARSVALAKPTESERGQWYFQRYVPHLPTAGDIVLFDRSWYNRAGVERVMGFCSDDQLADFLRDAPEFENLLVQDGVCLVKIYLTIGRDMQLVRFHERRHNPLKQWKLTDIDLAAIGKWDDYTRALADMFRFTHTPSSPWWVVHANDQRRARLEAIRLVLSAFDYADKDAAVAHAPDPKIVGNSDAFLYGKPTDT
ncbi:MAG: polyphosphate kinase 2 [Hyphomicrobiaceae bacterium]|nr:polyphosphate kinase 2 [Hyphomicrobiaceae bacterium]